MSSTSTPPPRPATRPQNRPSTSNNVNLHSRQERSPRRSASGSPHGSNSSRSNNAARRVRPEITIVSAQPMSTHPAFADGRKGGYIPPEAPPSYDDALKSSVPLDPMFTDPAIPDHISANLRAFPIHQVHSGLHSSSLPVIHTESLPPPHTVTSSSSLNVIAPTPRTRRNIGNTNNSNNTNESVSLDNNTASTREGNSVPVHENQNVNKENISPLRKPQVPTKPKSLRKADTPTSNQSQASGTSSNVQKTLSHSSANQNKIQKRVAVNPELTEVEVHNQEEFHKKKQKIIERLKQLKEEQNKSENNNIQSDNKNMDDKKLKSENLSQDNNEVKKPTNRRLPPPPRPPSLPSVKPRSVPPANASKQKNLLSTEQKVQNNESKDSSNENESTTQFGMLINFDDDDPYATIDHTKDNKPESGESSQPNKEVKHMSNVDLLCFELGPKPEESVNAVHKEMDDVEKDNISLLPNKEIPMPNSSPKPVPRKTKPDADEDNGKPEDVYAVVRKPRKSIKKIDNLPAENKSEEAADICPPVPSSRPPPSDYEGLFVDAEEETMKKPENNKPDVPITAPPRTRRVHRNSSSKTPEITRRNQTIKKPDPVRRHSSQKTPEVTRKVPPRPAPPPIPSSKPKATQDDAVVYSKSKHVTIESPPEQATVVLRNINCAEPKKRSKSFKLNRKSFGFFSSSKKDDGNSSSTSSSSEKTKPSPKVRPKSTMFPSRSDNKLKVAKSPVDNNPTGRKPLRSAPPRPMRPAPQKPQIHQSNNNNSSEDIHKIANPVPTARPRSKSTAAKCVSMQSESVQTERPPPPNRPAPTRSKSIKPLHPPPVKATKETQTQTVSFDLGGESITKEQKNELNNEKPQPVNNQKTLGKVCAKFDYESNESGDLQFQNGDIIVVLSEINQEWYKGKLNEEIGIFPKAYVGELKSVPSKRPQLLRRPTKDKPVTKTEIAEKVTHTEDTQPVSKPHYDPTTPDWGDDDEDHSKEVPVKNWDVAELDLSPVPVKREDVRKHNEEFFDAVEDLHSHDDHVDGFDPKENISHEIENINGIVQNTHTLDFGDEELTETDAGLTTMNHLDDGLDEDVISNDIIEYIEPKCAVAIYKFEGTDKEELSFEAGNVITVLGEVNEEWLKGEFRGKSGIFPSNFIQEIKDS